MNIYSLIPIICIILSLGYWFYNKLKLSATLISKQNLQMRHNIRTNF